MIKPSPDSRRLAAQAIRLVRNMDKTGMFAILLAGSTARGMAHPQSDLDIVILCDQEICDQLTTDYVIKPHPQFSEAHKFEKLAIGNIKNIKGEYFLVTKESLGQVLDSDCLKTMMEFHMLKLITDAVPLWEDSGYLGATIEIQRRTANHLQRGPYRLNDEDYLRRKESLLSGVYNMPLEKLFKKINTFIFQSMGIWPVGIGPAVNMKHSKLQLPTSFYNLAIELGEKRAELASLHAYDARSVTVQHREGLAAIVKKVFNFIDAWRQTPDKTLCHHEPGPNRLTIRDFAP